MIRINLLPEQHRRKARTPLKLVLTLGLAAAANAGLVSWWAWSAFGVQAVIDSEASTLQLEVDGLAPQVAHHRSLEGEAKAYKSREDTLASITASRLSWTKKLDEFVDVVNRGAGDRHLVWFDDLQVATAADPKAKNGGTLRANGHSGSDNFSHVANFDEDLENSPFAGDFEPPPPPQATAKVTDDTLVPATVWTFPLALSIKSADERSGKKAGAKAAAPKAGAKPADAGASPASGKSKEPAAAGGNGR